MVRATVNRFLPLAPPEQVMLVTNVRKKEEVAARVPELPESILVAFGAPRQDLWIRRNLHDMRVKVAIGVGGLFDFYSGRHPRAPMWMRRIGIEWAHRLILEPRRLWKRYLIGNVVFLARVVKGKYFPKAV